MEGPFSDLHDTVIAITGGTGRYATAEGEAKLSARQVASSGSIYGLFAPSRRFHARLFRTAVPLYPRHEGLEAAARLVMEKMRVNMTLCFSQAQAAAIYAATKGAAKGDVFVSPFVGRLDDRGENGMDFLARPCL